MTTAMVWSHRTIDAPAERVWRLLTDLDQWPRWGPSVRRADLDGDRFELGATGTITTVVGIRLGFEITAHEPGRRWAWNVAGIPATDHRIEARSDDRCRVGFGAPWPAAAYLVVLRAALGRVEALAETHQNEESA